jgi:hypothetical protein
MRINSEKNSPFGEKVSIVGNMRKRRAAPMTQPAVDYSPVKEYLSDYRFHRFAVDCDYVHASRGRDADAVGFGNSVQQHASVG